MKYRKQIVSICAVILFFVALDVFLYNEFTSRYINRTSEAMQAKSIELDKYLPFNENSQVARVKTSIKLDGDLPVLDGAAAIYPVYSGFVAAVYPEESVVFDGENFTQDSKLQYTNTRGAYQSVVDGNADIVFCAKPSEEQLQYAKDAGVELEFVPIGHEAFVFLVNKDNPVNNLTCDQVRRIYSADITNWAEIGGDNRPVDALQRNEGSGSQTALESFMGDTPLKKKISGLNGSAIGFSFRFYVEGIVGNGDIKMLALDGVYPDKKNIANGTYPVVADLYAVYDKANENKNIPVLIDWILSDEGQKVVEESGYVPVK